MDPDSESTLRPTRIPTSGEPFGSDGQAILSVKQSRFGVNATLPTAKGPITTKFEVDMFGTATMPGRRRSGCATPTASSASSSRARRTRCSWMATFSPTRSTTRGPAGMVFFRNTQIRWTPISGDNTLAVALENPGNDIDTGQYSRDLEQGGFTGQSDEKVPDLTAHYRMKTGFGHVQIAGILRRVGVEVVDSTNTVTFKDSTLGWGVDLTGTLNLGDQNVIRAGLVHGEGIASYMNDGGMDAGPDRPPGDPGVQVEAVPLTGLTLYLDHTWNDRYTSSIGYSFTEVDNTSGQTADAFNKGEYASVNLLYTPVENVLVGIEGLWGTREDNGGNNGDDARVQFTMKYNFGTKL